MEQGNLAQPNDFRRHGTPSNSSKLNRFQGVGRVEGFGVREQLYRNPEKSHRDLGRPPITASLADGGDKVREEAGDFALAPTAGRPRSA
jgi:hypothetical protein